MVDGCGWVWLGALFRTAQFRLVNFLENGRDCILKENKGFYITKNENYTLKSTKYQAHNFISTYFSFFRGCIIFNIPPSLWWGRGGAGNFSKVFFLRKKLKDISLNFK